jgi:hypothetical protein
METTTFALAEATSIATKELVFLFGYNFGWAYAAAGAGTYQIAASRAGSEMETYSRTYAGCIGTSFGLYRGTSFFLDARVASPFETKETEKKDATVGMHMVGQGGVTFDLTRKSMDLVAGMRYSTLAVSFEGTGGTDVLTAPFVALRWGFDP